jgi:methyltransferase (TIGR00027 family)
MKASRSSKTAEQMALSRAIESRKPPEERICYDPVAEQLLSAQYRIALLARPLRDGVERLIERLFAGHHYYVVARTRCFDDFLLSQLPGKPEQLVILGAGFDSRVHRFADRLQGVKAFEVDHPATSQDKQRRMQAIVGEAARSRVTYVPVDFNVEKLADKLRSSGFSDGRRTIFLWEGVTPYLHAQAVNETLGFIASSSASGSTVMFDYILESVVAGRCELRGAHNEFEKMQRTSEPLTFGIAEGGAMQFLSERGFREIVDAGGADLQQRYFAGVARYVKPWWRIVHATVP